jgi:hypothetical protein
VPSPNHSWPAICAPRFQASKKACGSVEVRLFQRHLIEHVFG